MADKAPATVFEMKDSYVIVWYKLAHNVPKVKLPESKHKTYIH